MRHTRNSDPHTSHLAALSESDPEHTSRTKEAILVILKYQAMTDSEMIRVYRDLVEFGDAPKASDSGLRSRRSELVAAGLVEFAGFGVSDLGRKSIVWQTVT